MTRWSVQQFVRSCLSAWIADVGSLDRGYGRDGAAVGDFPGGIALTAVSPHQSVAHVAEHHRGPGECHRLRHCSAYGASYSTS